MKQFEDRGDAGCWLAKRLDSLRGQDIAVWACREVRVVYEFAKAPGVAGCAYAAQVGVPFQPELAFGVVGQGPVFRHPHNFSNRRERK